MARVVLAVMAIVAVIMVVVFATQVMSRAMESARHTAQEVTLPKSVKTTSYVLLIVLMFGVVTGWLGGL